MLLLLQLPLVELYTCVTPLTFTQQTVASYFYHDSSSQKLNNKECILVAAKI